MRGATRIAGEGRPHDTDTPDVHTSSAGYRQRFEGGGRLALVRQMDVVTQLLRAIGGRGVPLSVLDVGGGHAQLAGLLCGAGHRVVVHGSTPECFTWIAPLAQARPDRIAPCVSRLTALPFADGTFDLVCGIRLMAHVTDWRALLAEMTRVTRRYLLVDYPLYAGVQRFSGRFFALKHKVESNTRPFFLYRREEVAAELSTLGVHTVRAVGQLVLPLALHRALRAPRASLRIEHALERTGLAARIGSPVLLLGERSDRHPERSEGSPLQAEIPRCARDDGSARDDSRSARNDTLDEHDSHHAAQEIRS
ncbi:MAG TPA: methyltransferase domain-containing protein [Gemmatimonadaceae bacterium]